MPVATALNVKLTVSHDWIRVAVKCGKEKLSLTSSRYKESCSGTVGIDRMRAAIKNFAILIDRKEAGNMGQKMDRLALAASDSSTIDEFISRIANA